MSTVNESNFYFYARLIVILMITSRTLYSFCIRMKNKFYDHDDRFLDILSIKCWAMDLSVAYVWQHATPREKKWH